MANRSFTEDVLTIQKRMVRLWGVFLMSGTTPVLRRWDYKALGGTAAYVNAATTGGGTAFPRRYAQGAEGIFSVARTGAGLWTVVLSDSYQRLLGLQAHQSFAGGLGTIVAAHENTTITNMASAGGSTIGVALISATGTAADPATTTVVRIAFDLCDATEP